MDNQFTNEVWAKDLMYRGARHGIAASVGPSAWAVYCAIATHLPEPYPGSDRIAELAGVSVRTVESSRKLLRDVGLINTGPHGKADTLLYTFTDIASETAALRMLNHVQKALSCNTTRKICGLEGDVTHSECASTHNGCANEQSRMHNGCAPPAKSAGGDPQNLRVGAANSAAKGKQAKARKGKVRKGAPAAPALAGGFAPASPPSPSAQDEPQPESSASPRLKGSSAATISGSPDYECPTKAANDEPGGQRGAAPAAATTMGGRPVATASRHRRAERADPAALTDDQKLAACASIESMTSYLLWGAAGLAPGADATNLKPSSLNWRVHTNRDNQPQVAKWTVPQLAGFWWYLISNDRALTCQPPKPLTLPNLGRIIGDVRNLRQRFTAEQVYHRMRSTIEHWYLVCYMAGKIGATLELTESSLSHGIIANNLDVILSRGQEWAAEQYDRMARGLPVTGEDFSSSREENLTQFAQS